MSVVSFLRRVSKITLRRCKIHGFGALTNLHATPKDWQEIGSWNRLHPATLASSEVSSSALGRVSPQGSKPHSSGFEEAWLLGKQDADWILEGSVATHGIQMPHPVSGPTHFPAGLGPAGSCSKLAVHPEIGDRNTKTGGPLSHSQGDFAHGLRAWRIGLDFQQERWPCLFRTRVSKEECHLLRPHDGQLCSVVSPITARLCLPYSPSQGGEDNGGLGSVLHSKRRGHAWLPTMVEERPTDLSVAVPDFRAVLLRRIHWSASSLSAAGQGPSSGNGQAGQGRQQDASQSHVPGPGAAPNPTGAKSGTGGSADGGLDMSELAEECDEAVEDLGEVRARVRATREAVQKGKGVLRASWLLLGALLRSSWQMLLSLRSLGAVLKWSRKDWLDTLAGWWRAIRHAAHHYWVGTKLLWADIRISSRLLLKTAKGSSLTRRERQQLMRTSADIFRLVPFAVFVIVPFMEFLLPVALRLFPNMLPSTYQDKDQEQKKVKRLLQARLLMAGFLQDMVQEMAREVKGKRSGEVKKTAEELNRFMAKVRTGGQVSNEEILAFASLFNDELTLDNMTRPRLVSMCKYMGLQTFGTDAYLRYILRARLAWIKEDDMMIEREGVESLSEAELRAACRERGMLGLVSVDTMRKQLRDWLVLSLNRSVPSSLLILSRAFLVSGKVRPEEAVQATLSSLPERVVASVGASVPSGDETSERQRKLDKLKEEEKLIREEAAEAERQRKAAVEEARDRAREEMREDRGLAAGAEGVAAVGVPAGLAAGAAGTVTPEEGLAPEEAQQLAQERAQASRDQLCKLSAALAVLASSSSVSKERVDFLRLVNREIELYNSLVEKTGLEGEEEARVAYAAAREASEREAASEGEGVSDALINKVDGMLHQLEKELDAADAKIGSKLRILDTDYDGKVSPEELAAAAALLRDTLGQGQVAELISSLAKDKDGKILVEDIVRLGTMDTADDGPPEEERQEAQSL